jgi:hypothetical protein
MTQSNSTSADILNLYFVSQLKRKHWDDATKVVNGAAKRITHTCKSSHCSKNFVNNLGYKIQYMLKTSEIKDWSKDDLAQFSAVLKNVADKTTQDMNKARINQLVAIIEFAQGNEEEAQKALKSFSPSNYSNYKDHDLREMLEALPKWYPLAEDLPALDLQLKILHSSSFQEIYSSRKEQLKKVETYLKERSQRG